MILKTLTPKQTGIWIKNLQKLLSLRNAVKKYHNSEYDRAEKLFNESYGWLYKAWHSIDGYEDLHLMWNGTYHVPMSMICSHVKKLETVPPHMVEYRKRLIYEYRDTRDTLLKRLQQKWERYAEQPFQIQEGDLVMYENLKVWHQELKNVLVEGGVYDETLDLDEDC
ncbi:hypothetical protein BZF66_06385 [Salmonella enterica]|nr:hypothetical protein CPT_Munch_130 [Salmonella phage Munch]EAZ2022923.1 hypothetical protein [Salmonella enterica]ECV9084057.1 hypothetical protein [Salmonella enterica subsp. enterica serovar Infantis]EHX8550376.1 hypothetical protein [Salmonella enterica]EME3783094.1 hypothetical protein [Salmonella enterica]